MKKIEKKLATLPKEDFEIFCSNIRSCLILGGEKTCSCISLQDTCKRLGLTVRQVLAWYKRKDKDFTKKFLKKA